MGGMNEARKQRGPMISCPKCGHQIKVGRSKGQRGYYFEVIVKAYSEAMGEEDLDLVNNWLKIKFNPKFDSVGGDEIKYGGSIEKEPVHRIEELYEQMRAFAMNFYGVYIPEPNEVPLAEL